MNQNAAAQTFSLPQSLVSTENRRRDSEAFYDSRSNSKASSMPGPSLRDRLHDARIECPQRAHTFFVPRSILEDLINVSSVAQDLRSHNSEINENDATKYASKACESARRLYATLAYIEKGADICLFLNEGITDEHLPLVRQCSARSKFALFRTSGESIKALEAWQEEDLGKFGRSQWWMISPVFHLGQDLYDLDANMLLPFVPFDTTRDELAHKQGGYSEVYPEETILRAVAPRHHPHLIKLLATYKHEGKYHLMFPYANANLKKYWDDRPNPAFDRVTVLWTVRQMAGIANGLCAIHSFRLSKPLVVKTGDGKMRVAKGIPLKVRDGEEWYGRHGDIKPENVLWFRRDQRKNEPNEILQIADFGLGRFHGRDSRSAQNPRTIQGSPTYEPPEYRLRQPVSRAYDIWSLGCVYLEFVTWLLQGSQALATFSSLRGRVATRSSLDDDNFFTIVNDGQEPNAVVRDKVVDWENQLHHHERCSDLIHDLLELIMKGLLVIDAKQRYPADWIFQQLKAIMIRAEKDEAYWLKPNPDPVEPANDRSISTPAVLTVPTAKSKRKTVTYTEDTKGPAAKG
ncbi:hypothetical protein ONS95_011834 [Cadophora gregata]|uniref:uncharacterized protein n=1 Tax=Cadophora gregata TaxID=51156 RepID=UPI0026DC0499|nr:uncharacterized protein ONS95_011834 [Cadophora gregata]KAK0117494.1 hypothetical protein ONS95_011834 [Cadophora gregata]KAK0122549.1 hypothetical protein ONS96_009591 [Cadophora gregata f. sp. sojae]